jgi:sarcosine oxidase
MKDADIIVLGLGGMGSAALAALARRGADVLGLEQFEVGHDRGSSHGETRLIRKAYFEHPDYVPLLEEAYGLWRGLQSRARETIFDDGLGLVMLGRPDTSAIAGTLEAARTHGLPIHEIDPRERWIGAVPEGFVALWDAEGGMLRVERCVRAHVDDALRHGARLRTGARAIAWRAGNRGVSVELEDGSEVRGRRLVVTPGPWAPALLPGLPLEVRRKVLLWFRAREAEERYALGAFPPFVYDLGDRFVYGFPDLGEGVKVADHRGGQGLVHAEPDRSLLDGDSESVVDAIARFLPGLDPRPVRHVVCMYTMTPDEHFVVDVHPEHAEVVVAAGFSGHGFKFAPVVGEALADLALDGGTGRPIAFLGIDRLSGRSAASSKAPRRTRPRSSS